MSLTEILIILLIVLVFLGPEKIPETAKMIGKGLREVRKASNLLRDAVMIDEDDRPSYASRSLQDDEDDYETEEDWARDPDPSRDLQIVEMSPRTIPGTPLKEVALTAAKAELQHREVYLHIPYVETV